MVVSKYGLSQAAGDPVSEATEVEYEKSDIMDRHSGSGYGLDGCVPVKPGERAEE